MLVKPPMARGSRKTPRHHRASPLHSRPEYTGRHRPQRWCHRRRLSPGRCTCPGNRCQWPPARRPCWQWWWECKGRDSIPALFFPPLMLCLGNGNATNAAGNDDAAAVQVHLRPVQTTAFHGLPGSHHSKLGEPPHPLCSLTVQHRLRLEVLDLCSQLDLQPRWIILGDGPNAAHPWRTASQLSWAVRPSGVTAPIPVITTRLLLIRSPPTWPCRHLPPGPGR